MPCCLLYRTDTLTERHQQVLCDCQQVPCMHRDCILEPIQVYRKRKTTVRALRPYPSLLSSWPSSVCAPPLQLLSVSPLAPSVGQNSLSIPSTQDYIGQSFAKLRTCRFSHNTMTVKHFSSPLSPIDNCQNWQNKQTKTEQRINWNSLMTS